MVKGNGLIHASYNFSPHNIRVNSKFYGLRKDFLELHVWIYEIISQIEKISTKKIVLKGGGAAQLYIPLDFQRCTADLDIKTDLNEEEIVELLTQIKHNLKKNGIDMSFEKYIPKFIKDEFHVLPMVTYILRLPFTYSEGIKRGLKIDFLFGSIDEANTAKIDGVETLGLELKYPITCVSRDTLIGEKLLTFAVNSIGLETFKVDSLYKNLYDLYYLINLDSSLESFKSVVESVKRAIEIEAAVKDLSSLSIESILQDIIDTLLDLFTWDLGVKDASPHRKLKRVMETSMQRNIRHNLTLDTWAVIAMNIYVFTKSIYEYIESGRLESLEVIDNYIDDMEYITGFNKGERKKYKNYINKTITNWRNDLSLDNYHSTERLVFLVNLIENELI